MVFINKEPPILRIVKEMVQDMLWKDSDSYWGRVLEIKYYIVAEQYLMGLARSNQLLQARPQDKEGYQGKIRSLDGLERFDEALEVGQIAEKLYWYFWPVLCVKAETLWNMKRFYSAKVLVKRAEYTEPYLPQVLLCANNLYVKSHDRIEDHVVSKKVKRQKN